jgi:hypothetical protein
MSAENVSLALKALRDGQRPACPWCRSPMSDVRMAEEDGETYGHATWMCGYGISWVVGDIEHDQCTIKLSEFDGKMRMCWEWEIAALRAEVARLRGVLEACNFRLRTALAGKEKCTDGR